MKDVRITIEGIDPGFAGYREMTGTLAEKDNAETMLVAWWDSQRKTHSPSCVKCSIGGEPGWEVYGRTHEGRLRFSVNKDAYVFIYT